MPSLVTKNKTFTLEHRVYFNETNAVGGVAYFSNYVKWQGMAREEYFMQTVPSWRDIVKLISLGQLNMITIEEHSHFIQHAFFGDKLLIQLQTANVKRYSFDMLFIITNTETHDLLYEGMQKLAFDDFHGKFIEIPRPMLESVLSFEADVTDIRFQKLRRYILVG